MFSVVKLFIIRIIIAKLANQKKSISQFFPMNSNCCL